MTSRYKSQILVSEIGPEGQKSIREARVLIIGGGGLGTPLLTYLVACGIGSITIVDGDIISIENLHRQYLFTENDLGKNKSETLMKKLSVINPEVNLHSIPYFLDKNNANKLISNCDIVCDCTDNAETRILIDTVCAEFQKPLVYAAVRDWIGYLTILNSKNKIRLIDIFSVSDLRHYSKDNCHTNGIVGPTCGILGSMQASEVLKIVLGQKLTLDGAILCINVLNNIQSTFKLKSTES